MSNLEFIVVNARAGNENQKKIGILANFSLKVVVDGVTIATLKDLAVRKANSGKSFIASPSKKYNRADGTEAYINFIELFPDDKTGANQNSIIEQVRRECESAPAPRSGGSGGYTKPSAPANPKPSPSSERW